MKTLQITLVSVAALTACSQADQGNNTTAGGNTASTAETGAGVPCDMTPPPDHSVEAPDTSDMTPADRALATSERASAGLDMRRRAKACAEAAGFTDVQDFTANRPGTRRQNTAGDWVVSEGESWVSSGTRDGVRMRVIVEANGEITSWALPPAVHTTPSESFLARQKAGEERRRAAGERNP